MRKRESTSFIGTEFTGVSYADLKDDALFDEVVTALRERELVVLRSIELTVEQQIELATRIGSPVPFVMKNFRHPDYPEIMVSSNEKRNNLPIGVPRLGNFWHHDSSFTANPAQYTMLHGVNVPSATGHTKFASACDVYDRLPARWQEKLDGLVGLHTINKQQRIGPQHVGLSIAEMRALVDVEHPKAEHPLVRTEPFTGRKFLYASREYMDSVPGLDANDNVAFFDLLDELLGDEDHVYTHVWSPLDLLIWNTATTYHVATPVEPGVSRTVHRVSITTS